MWEGPGMDYQWLSASQQCSPGYKYVSLSIVNDLMRGSVAKWKESEILRSLGYPSSVMWPWVNYLTSLRYFPLKKW